MSKKRSRRQRASGDGGQENVIHLDEYTPHKRYRKKKVEIVPRNLSQEDYIFAIEDYSVIFGVGPAGTGKTLLATLAAIKALKDGEIDRIVITRPAVSVDEQHGYLPGSLVEKMAPWTRPIFDVFEDYWNPKQIEAMIEDGVIEIAPLAYMRGRTFHNAWVIADEMQNATPSQMKMVLTRIGQNSKMIITGDLEQHDRGYEENGLKDFLHRFNTGASDEIAIIRFGQGDVERSPVVTEVLDFYNE